MTSASATVKKPLGGLNRLSQMAKMAVAPKPEPVADDEILISKIYIKKQVRHKLGNIEALVASIKAKGEIHTKLWIHEESDGRYRLIAGHRRFTAAPLAGYDKVPCKIYRGLSELQIRALQVSENQDRENLSAFDQAMGVIEDVQLYGMEEARRIWNQPDPKNEGKQLQSEGWMSKRIAVTRYAPQVLELLQLGLCEDFEILHSLNQLQTLHQQEFDALVAKVHNGEQLSRDEARSKVAAVREWLERKQTAPAAQHSSASKPTTAGGAEVGAAEGDGSQANGGAGTNDTERHDDAGGAGLAEGEESGQAATSTVALKVAAVRSPGRDKKGEDSVQDLVRTRAAMIGTGRRVGKAFDAMLVDMNELDLQLSEGEWVLWQAFVAAVGPLAAKLGKARAQTYLTRLSRELKGQDASAAIGKLMSSMGLDDETPGEMPEGWTF